MLKIDFSKDFEREVRSWRRNARIDAAKYSLLFLAKLAVLIGGFVFFAWLFQAVFFGFFTTNF